jgi:hypothetical protein
MSNYGDFAIDIATCKVIYEGECMNEFVTGAHPADVVNGTIELVNKSCE